MTLHICTAVAANYIPQARVLAASVLEQHPGARVGALVTDPEPPPGVLHDEPFEPLRAADVGIDAVELARRALAYSPQALVSSLKPALLRACLARAGGAPVLLLDSDILVTGDLRGVAEQAARCGILLSPHAPMPLPHVPGGPNVEEEVMRAGVFNGGFLGVAPGGDAAAFLDWWDARCARDCVWDPERGLVLSQSWLALVPALFGHGVLRDPGCNVLPHGLYGRDVSRDGDGRRLIGGDPLRFHHFGGFDPSRPERLMRSAPDVDWMRLEARPGVAELIGEYVARLRAAGLHELSGVATYGSVLPDGTPVGPTARRAYLDGLIAAEAGVDDEPPNPLLSGDSDAFRGWLRAHAPGTRAVSRYVLALRARRADLRGAYPAVPGADEDGLLTWAANDLEAQDPEWASVRRGG